MKFICLFSILLLVAYSGATLHPESKCGDNWVPYKEEYCYRVFATDALETHENAEGKCEANRASLVSLRYLEEQTFLRELLFKSNSIVDNLWLEARFEGGKYRWDDGSELLFANWAPGSPKNRTGYCVAMHAEEDLQGKWMDELCARRNVVVCQKKQTWSVAKLQAELMEVKANPVPVGFTYVQLPKEKAPKEIWPWMEWKDVSEEYDGAFFRAGSGAAAQFGTVQEANSNRVEKVDCRWGQQYKYDVEVPLTPGQWSDRIFTGDTDGQGGDYRYSWKLYLTPGEVRPRNMAMRIWKRTA